MKASEAEAQRAKMAQPLTLGLVRSICRDLLVDSDPTTKLVAIAILRNIGKLAARPRLEAGVKKPRKSRKARP